jgi:phosphatidylinositol alpha-1,6-mannosyltransferase
VRHLLVTNDFPPKHGGIQTYLWELWRRLPAGETTVLTTPHEGAAAWDRAQELRIVRSRRRVLLPAPSLVRHIDQLAAEVDAGLVLLDPVLPLGLVGPRLERPFGLVVHGAEVTVPGRLPGVARLLGSVLRRARLVVAAGGYPAAESERAARQRLPVAVVPPGVDVDRFRPLAPDERAQARATFGVAPEATVVLGLSRLVPRKGFDALLRAAGRLAPSRPGLVVAIAGGGRDRSRLERVAAEEGAPARFLGRVPDHLLPSLYGAADVFAMLCRDRWGGLEQEGFGVVFLEAAAAGVPQLAGASGGAAEAVLDGETGLVVRRPADTRAVADALATLVDDPALCARIGAAARRRAEEAFDYDRLAERLGEALAGVAR